MAGAALSLVLGTAAAADVIEIDDAGAVHLRAGASQVRWSDQTAVGEHDGADDREGPEESVEAASGAAAPSAALTLIGQAEVPAAYAAAMEQLARRYDLSPRLIAALVWQESRWRADAVSAKGAVGLAQLMPGTARALGVNPADPIANLEGGARFLRQMLDAFDGDVERALAAYNAGPGRVLKAGGVPAIPETRAYVASIVNHLSGGN